MRVLMKLAGGAGRIESELSLDEFMNRVQAYTEGLERSHRPSHLPPDGRLVSRIEPVHSECVRVVIADAQACPRARRYFAAPILNILVPQTGQTPSVAGRPFFIVTCFASLISRWVLHFMQ
jgi:hypothetical protein